ncbi:2OG-Fe(II) oxygenase [Acetobacter sp. LMG 1636]|uniref:2OG-Fe(II) oxygenase n=2 Tax=Acetobacter fallax TaxID=1737473 RepID=A0ABX0K611_9PROT|nr:2OG-Fe(II) oxygenase [Acetobacter fallax]NHO35300.1 2OG-Fe(II) oxygenase [Acetobacter fallax]
MTGKPADLPFSAARYFSLVNAPEFIAFLEAVTGIPSLRPDLTLLGGGVHEAGANGHFEIHVDFQKHPSTGLQNRLAVITYLNTDWTEADGGALELWNMKDNRSGATIPPLLGRTVIMGQSPVAAHGYPEPLPGSRPRRALIAYFYSQPDKPAGAMISTTRYIRRPGMPLSSHLQMTLRDIFPQPIVRSLRQIRSRFTHKRSR